MKEIADKIYDLSCDLEDVLVGLWDAHEHMHKYTDMEEKFDDLMKAYQSEIQHVCDLKDEIRNMKDNAPTTADELWECLKVYFNEMNVPEVNKYFDGRCGLVQIMEYCKTPDDFISRVNLYWATEYKSKHDIQIGDEIQILGNGCAMIVTDISYDENEEEYCVKGIMSITGSGVKSASIRTYTLSSMNNMAFKKTGKHYDSIPLDYGGIEKEAK